MESAIVFFAITIWLASVLASVISGMFGMAGGMVLMGIYSAMMPVQLAMVLHGITQFSSNSYRWYILREHTYWSGIIKYVVGSVIAVIVFYLLAIVPNKAVVYLMLGIVPFAAAALPKSLKLDFTTRWTPPVVGFLVTAVQFFAGAAGPVLDVFFVDARLTKNQVVSTKALTQSIAHASKVFYFALLVAGPKDWITHTVSWWIIIGSIVSTFLGTEIGHVILKRFSEAQFRVYTKRVVLFIGAYYLVRGVMLLSW